MPMLPDQLWTWCESQVDVGWPARTTQRQAIAIGTNANRRTGAEIRGQPHFVHPPSSCESAMTSPAPATSPTLVQ